MTERPKDAIPPRQFNCGEATMRLLADYGVDTVFGIPGFHTLEFYRGLAQNSIRHILPRNEQGASFMADGYARAAGKPGVCLTISGPGVTNASTGVGQAYADSVPLLLLTSTNASETLGKGWGCLHETADQQRLTEAITGSSTTALNPADIPDFIGQAFGFFAAGRPRPAHVAIPLDLLEAVADGDWSARPLPDRPIAARARIADAVALLATAERPLIVVGGGASAAGRPVTELAEWLDATVIATNAGKGVVPDSHPLSLGGGLIRPQVRDHLAQADVVLALGTELAATDSFVERLTIGGRLIRVDIDPGKLADAYPAEVGVLGDAAEAVVALLAGLRAATGAPRQHGTAARLVAVRRQVVEGLSPVERQHKGLWDILRAVLPAETIIWGDISRIVYTGSAVMPVELPRRWFYPAGFGALGCAVPCAIGARIACPDTPVVAVAGDGGLMFTVQELMTASELRLPIPVIVWNDRGYGMIRHGMDASGIVRTAESPGNPEFRQLAAGLGCGFARPDSAAALQHVVASAFTASAPTLIVVDEGADWLDNGHGKNGAGHD